MIKDNCTILKYINPLSLLRRILFILVLFNSWILASVVSSTYNVYNYDLTTPLFTPDGLLKQVQYASEACQHSPAMVVIPLFSISNTGDIQTALIIATTHTTSVDQMMVSESKNGDEIPHRSQFHHNTGKSKNDPSKRGQSRIIPIPIAAPNAYRTSIPYYKSSNSHIILGLNGLLPDNVSLLQIVHQHLHQMRSKYGMHKVHTIINDDPNSHTSSKSITRGSLCSPSIAAKRIAQAIANKCQQHSFGGGIRPFGSQFLVSTIDSQQISIFVTHPSGSFDSYIYTNPLKTMSTSTTSNSILTSSPFFSFDAIVLGNQPSIRENIKKQILDALSNYQQNSDIQKSSISSSISEQRLESCTIPTRQHHSLLHHALRATVQTLHNHLVSSLNIEKDENSTEFLASQMDVVFITSESTDVHRLEEYHIQHLLESTS